MESLVTLLKLRTWRPLFRPGSPSRLIVPSHSNTCSITRSTAPRRSSQHITWCKRNSGLGERNYRDLAWRHDREFHHKAKKKKIKHKKQKTFHFCSLTHIYTTIFIRGSCVRRVYVFSLRELGPNLSLIDFIKNVNALIVKLFCKVCCVLVVEMFSSFYFILSIRVIISTYEPLYNYRNFNFLLLL